MKIRLKVPPQGPHYWFAWYPVIARKKCPTGHVPHLVFLQRVTRTRVTAMGGLAQWLYEVD